MLQPFVDLGVELRHHAWKTFYFFYVCLIKISLFKKVLKCEVSGILLLGGNVTQKILEVKAVFIKDKV